MIIFIVRLIQMVTLYKYDPSLKAIKELKNKKILNQKVNYWKSKYLNNILEQDLRLMKNKLLYENSFQSTYIASATIKRIEVVSVLYKESRREINLLDFFPWDKIENLFKAT